MLENSYELLNMKLDYKALKKYLCEHNNLSEAHIDGRPIHHVNKYLKSLNGKAQGNIKMEPNVVVLPDEEVVDTVSCYYEITYNQIKVTVEDLIETLTTLPREYIIEIEPIDLETQEEIYKISLKDNQIVLQKKIITYGENIII